MDYSDLKVPFGLRDGQLLEPGKVVSGKKCNCFCPDPKCNRPLIANHSRKSNRRSYFSHEPKGDGRTNDCAGVESAIHLMGKAVLAEGLKLHLPEYVRSTGSSVHSATWYIPATKIEHYFSPVVYRNVILEKEVIPGFRPDAQVTVDGFDKPLLVEIRVTHAVGDKKADELRKAGFRAIEIDLSGLPRKLRKGGAGLDRQEVENQVHELADRVWLCEPELDHKFTELKRQKEWELQLRIEEEKKLAEEQDRKLNENQKRANDFREKLRENESKVGTTEVSSELFDTKKVRQPHQSNQDSDLADIPVHELSLHNPLMEEYLTFPFRRYMSSFSVSYSVWQMRIIQQLLIDKVCLLWQLIPWIYLQYVGNNRSTVLRLDQAPPPTDALVSSNQSRAIQTYLRKLARSGILYFSEGFNDPHGVELTLSVQSTTVIDEWIRWSIYKNDGDVFDDREFSKERFLQSCAVRQTEILYSAGKIKATPGHSGFVCGCCNLFFLEPVGEACPLCSSANEYVQGLVTDRYYKYLKSSLVLPSDRVALSVLKYPPSDD